MTSEEICRILNQHKHDGETDWACHDSDGTLVPAEVYFSRLQGQRHGTLFMPLSPASAEIIAQHYKGLEPPF